MKQVKYINKIFIIGGILSIGLFANCNFNNDSNDLSSSDYFYFGNNISDSKKLIICKLHPDYDTSKYLCTYDCIIKTSFKKEPIYVRLGIKGYNLYLLIPLLNNVTEIPILNFENLDKEFWITQRNCSLIDPALLMESKLMNSEIIGNDTIYFIKNTLRYEELEFEENHIPHEENRIIVFSRKNGVNGFYTNETGENDFCWPY
ncbi:MAG TPA: hypothetical protein PLP11_09425 [Bacteroidales bacterium]|mgnify:CR=1 FL=1|nr:hypothetical protein [Bacteroidales bacterium]HQP04810.1 hypothetical protein [Bacteroidales bacterium]